MKVQIMTDSQYGNGKELAETLKSKFSNEFEVNTADVKDVSPEIVAEFQPDVIILGGAIRAFMTDKKSKSWLKKLNGIMKESGKKIKYGTGFLTHAMPTSKVQGYAKKYLNAIGKNSEIEQTYSELLTAQVEGQKGPIFPEEMKKAENYIENFVAWLK
jgi:menaquinone-dependent protoporphyrinogen IX oxidase